MALDKILQWYNMYLSISVNACVMFICIYSWIAVYMEAKQYIT